MSLKSSRSVFFIALFILNLMIVAVLLTRNSASQNAGTKFITLEDHTINAVKAGNSQLSDKIQEQITTLRRESSAQSLQQLADVNLFFWPGPPLDPGGHRSGPIIPLLSEDYTYSTHAIMSNRRFLKVANEILADNSNYAAIKNELERALKTYSTLFAQDFSHVQKYFRKEDIKGKSSFSCPVYAIKKNSDPEDSLIGQKMKIVSLIWILGLKQHQESRSFVAQIAEVAKSQRETIYEDDEIHDWAKLTLLKMPSIYHPPVFVTTMLQLCPEGEEKRKLIDQHQLHLQKTDLVRYDTALTPYDLPMRFVEIPPDYSSGKTPVAYYANANDAAFDAALQLLQLQQ